MYSSLIVFGIVHVVQSIHYFHQYFKKPVPRKIKRMVKLIMNFLRIKKKSQSVASSVRTQNSDIYNGAIKFILEMLSIYS